MIPIVIDVSPSYSSLPTQAQLDQLKPICNGVLVGGEFPDWQAIRDYLDAYLTLGVPCGVYGFVEFQGDPLASIDNALRAADGRKIAWFESDLELPTHDLSPDQVLTISRAGIAHAQQARPDAETLCYTGPWWWNASAGDSTETFGVRGSIAGGSLYKHRDAGIVPPDPMFVPDCGGWTKAGGNIFLWQYQGTIETAGINTDRSIMVGELEQDMKSFNAWAYEIGRHYFVGPEGPKYVTDQATADELIKLFGPITVALSNAALHALGG